MLNRLYIAESLVHRRRDRGERRIEQRVAVGERRVNSVGDNAESPLRCRNRLCVAGEIEKRGE
jgi:hypothetical protein